MGIVSPFKSPETFKYEKQKSTQHLLADSNSIFMVNRTRTTTRAEEKE
jgi:hypothetical protein